MASDSNFTPNQEFSDILLQRSFNDPAKTKDKETGRLLASRIYRQQTVQDNLSYYGGRMARWRENHLWAKGTPNMKEFVDYTGVGGTNSYVNIDFAYQMKGAEICETLVTFLSSNEEYLCVSAIDDKSKAEKEQAKQDALYRMHDKENLAALDEAAGMPLSPPNEYTPENELDAEIKFELDYQLDKEIDYERKLEKVRVDNNWPQMKRRAFRDLCVFNMTATKIERMPNGYVFIKNCIPQNMIYNYFYNDNGKMQLAYIGEIYSLKIKDIRGKYGKSEERPNGLTEKEIWELGKTANQVNVANKFMWQWSDTYTYTYDRPYDDYGIDTFDFEILIDDASYWVSKTDNFGKENVTLKKGIPQPKKDTSKVIKQSKQTWYRGIWALQSDKMIYWGLPDVVIKPYMDISQSLSSYSIAIPNNDGEYVPSIFERAIGPLRTFTVSDLKIKQLISQLRPSGITVDTETIRDVDLGNGKTVDAMEVVKIYNQTGNVIWNSRGLNPNERQDIPIKELANAASVQQIVELTNIKNAAELEIRSLTGVSIYLQGQQVGDRTAVGLVEQQNASSNNVFGFIQTGSNDLWAETFNKICMLQWDKEILVDNIDDLMDSMFSVDIKLRPTAYEKTLLEQRIQTALANQLISFSDAERVRDIKNFKFASKYLAAMEDKSKKDALASSQQMQQENAKLQQQSNLMAQQQKDNAEQEKLKLEMKMEAAKSKNDKELALLNLMGGMLSKNIPIPDNWKPLEKELLQSIQVSLFIENETDQMAIDEGMQAAQQDQQSAQQPQQEPTMQ